MVVGETISCWRFLIFNSTFLGKDFKNSHGVTSRYSVRSFLFLLLSYLPLLLLSSTDSTQPSICSFFKSLPFKYLPFNSLSTSFIAQSRTPQTTIFHRSPRGTMAEKSDDDFAWSKCHDKTPHTRVCLKQQAVDDAFKYSQKLCHELKFALDQVGDEQKNAFNLMGGNEIRAWMKQLGKIS